MTLSRRTRLIAAAAASVALSIGALGAPSNANTSSGADESGATPIELGVAHGSMKSTVGALPPQLQGYQLAPGATDPTHPNAKNYLYGEREQDFLPECDGTVSPVAGHARVGEYFPNGRTPRVGDVIFTRLDFDWIGSHCGFGATTVGAEWVAPVGTDPWQDKEHQVVWAIYDSGTKDDEVRWHQNFFPTAGSHGGVFLQGTDDQVKNPEPWEVRQGQALTIFVPLKVNRRLVGAGSRPPSCQERRDGLGPCPAASSGDYLQVGVLSAHRAPGWYAPTVGLLASGAGTVVKASPTINVRPSTFKARRPGRLVVSVKAAGRRPTGPIVVRLGKRVVGRATLAARHNGTTKVRIKPLRRGKARLTISYGGDSAVRPGQVTRRIRVR